MIRIGLDAMGGDYAPQSPVLGAIEAAKEIGHECKIVLFGDKAQIETILEQEKADSSMFEIVHTTEVIDMGENPAQTFIKKPDSSIAVGFRHLMNGNISGFASAGSTGAMMVGCMYTVKQIAGIIRPTISSVIPTINGGNFLLLDVGLNVDCKPDVLYQYALIGNVYAKTVLGKQNPRIALLNIGEEKEKGNLAAKATYELLAEDETINFVGNIESKYLFDGSVADVVVCDGFVGNTVIKEIEAFYDVAQRLHIEDAYMNSLNYENVGGTPVLGINSNVVIGHGCSSPKAIKNMIIQTETTVKADFLNKLRETFN